MKEKLYADRCPMDLQPHFGRHMYAMTAEGLHDKADIALELAHRDAQIYALRNALGLIRQKCYSKEGSVEECGHIAHKALDGATAQTPPVDEPQQESKRASISALHDALAAVENPLAKVHFGGLVVTHSKGPYGKFVWIKSNLVMHVEDESV